MKTIIIIPALNEESAIEHVIRDLRKASVDEVVVVDNGSTDQTATRAAAAGATVIREPRRGYGWACLTGIAYAVSRSPDVVAFVDGDHSDHPEEIDRLLEPIARGDADFVIGSRILGQREPGALLPQALIGNTIACTLMRWFFGARFTDLGPFRAIRADALEQLAMEDKTYGWTVEMQIKAARAGLRCTEVPVSYRKRIGTSKVTGTVKGTVLASAKILWTIARYALTPLPADGKRAR